MSLPAATRGASRLELEVWDSIAGVTDPELDESVTALGFVTEVLVRDRHVRIAFHLPTFWCAANFAFMMASDLRAATFSLPWVESVQVELLEHMYSDTINRGIQASHSFQETFGAEANDEIDTVRAAFRRKAFQQRQELLLRHLLANGYSACALVALTLEDLTRLSPLDSEGQALLSRYQEIRSEHGGEAAPQSLAFVTIDVEPLHADQLAEYLLILRGIRINTQFNGQICRGLLDARYGDDKPGPREVRVDFPALARKSVT